MNSLFQHSVSGFVRVSSEEEEEDCWTECSKKREACVSGDPGAEAFMDCWFSVQAYGEAFSSHFSICKETHEDGFEKWKQCVAEAITCSRGCYS